MNTIKKLLLLVGAALLSTSCLSEQSGNGGRYGGGSNGGDGKVRFTLSVPKAAIGRPSTRSMTAAQEDALTSVDVLVYEGDIDGTGRFVSLEEGQQALDAGGDPIANTYEVILPTSKDATGYHLMILGNSGALLDELDFYDTEWSDVPAMLVKSRTTKWASDPIPMFGFKKNVKVDEELSLTGENAIDMHRMLAKIDVQLSAEAAGTDNDNFLLTDVYLCNYNTQGQVAPFVDAEHWGTTTSGSVNGEGHGVAIKPSIPSTANPVTGIGSVAAPAPAFHYAASETLDPEDQGMRLLNAIYTFEAETSGTTTDPAANPCLIVGGSFDGGAVSYYRVDFAYAQDDKVEYLSLLRNHRYIVTINKVLGAGYQTPDQAYNGGSYNIEANTMQWEEVGVGNIVFDGVYSLAVSHDEFKLPGMALDAGSMLNKLKIFTDVPEGWSATVNANRNGTGGTPTWLTLNPASDDADMLSTASLIAERNGTGDDRTAYVLIKAGRLTYVVEVTQSSGLALPVGGVIAPPGVLGVGSQTGKLTMRGSKEYAGSVLEEYANQEFGGLEDETVYMVHFKYGSLIAMSANTFDDAWSGKEDIAWTPPRYNVSGIDDNITYAEIPYDVTAMPTTGRDTEGLGDPCLYADAGTSSKTWRTPGVNVGYWNSIEYNESNTTYTNIAGIEGRIDNGTAEGGNPLWFFPYAGYRADGSGSNGKMIRTTRRGGYWSHDLEDRAGYGQSTWILYLDEDRTPKVRSNEASSHSQDYAYNVRCVAESGTTRPTGGVLAPPGVLGVGAKTGQLTMRGSMEYAYHSLLRDYATEAFGVNQGRGDGLADETVYVAYFKHGSLVALSGNTPDDTWGGKEDIAWVPREYDLRSKPDDIEYDAIPYYSGSGIAPVGEEAAGIGDPCRYADAGSKSTWHTPSADMAGYWQGVRYDTGNLKKTTVNLNGTKVDGRMDNGSVLGGNQNWFFPYVGIRLKNSGLLSRQATAGYYMTNTVDSNDDVYRLSIGDTNDPMGSFIDAKSTGTVDNAYAIRCVNEPAPKFARPLDGVLAPPGVLGVGIESGKLTLRGSKEYGAPVDNGSDAAKLTQYAIDNFGGLADETVYQVFFKWKSLIALNSNYNGEPWSGLADVAWMPEGFDPSGIDWSNWNNVPYAQENTVPDNIALGIGDPCQLADKGTNPNKTDWRVPTNGGTKFWNGIDYNQESGGGMGGTQTIAGVTGRKDDGSKGDVAWFFPYSGYRTGTGLMQTSVAEGRYWARTQAKPANNPAHPNPIKAHYLGVKDGDMQPEAMNELNFANSIRCLPEGSVDVANKPTPPTGGVLAPPGVLGIGATSGKLTLKGSREYAGTNQAITNYAVDNFGGFANETVYIAYFKYGSLVGMNGSTTNDTWSGKEDISWVPDEYNFANMSGKYEDILSVTGSVIPQKSVANAIMGLGDPCQYAEADLDGKYWRTPSTDDDGRWNGVSYSLGSLPETTIAGVEGRMDNGTVSGGNPAWFFPYTGSRRSLLNVKGDFQDPSWYMFYWTSTTVTNDANKSYILFGRNADAGGGEEVTPNRATWDINKDFGFAIRCVPDDLNKPNDGVLAPPGVLGVGAETGKLTLRGSKEYSANASIAGYATNYFAGGLANETVYLAYFKYGSLFAMSGETDGDTWSGKNDIMWVPGQYDVDNIPQNITYDAVPYTTNVIGAIPAKSDYWASMGVGDPCQYAEQDLLNRTWKTPSTDASGNWSSVVYNTTNLIHANLNLGGKVVAGRINQNATGGDNRWFFPYAGYRLDGSGTVTNKAIGSYYWTNRSNMDTYAYHLVARNDMNVVKSNDAMVRTNAIPIRCLPDPGLGKPTGGSLAPPGVLGVGATSGRLTLRGSKEFAYANGGNSVIESYAAQFGGLANETVYMAHFKYGSLIAMSGNPDDEWSGKEDVTWAPEGYPIGDMPYDVAYTDIPYANTGAFPATNNAATGIGDPCALADKGANTDTWHTPSVDAFGNWQGASYNTTTLPTFRTAGVDGRVDRGGHARSTQAWFFPYTGYRHGTAYNNKVMNQNNEGYYWTNHSVNANEASILYFDSGARVQPDTRGAVTSAHPIRCVPGKQRYFATKPSAGSVLAPPGVLGVGATSGKLTLKGSKEYSADSDIVGYAKSDFNGLADETVYVVYFKRNSVIALSGNTASDPWSGIDDVAWAPEEFDLSVINSDWASVPYNTVWADLGSPVSGKGDPCRNLYSENGGKYQTWITPAQRSSGTDIYWNGIQYDNTNMPKTTVAGVYGRKDKGTAVGGGGIGWFLPFAGMRDHTTGTLSSYHKARGMYWSRSMSDDGYIKILYFNDASYLYSSTYNTNIGSGTVEQKNTIAMPIRCVRERNDGNSL